MIARKLGMVVAAAVLAGWAAGAQAEEEAGGEAAQSFTGKALYFAGGGSYAIENVDNSVVSGDLSNSGGYDLRLGYFVHEMAGVEFEWQSLVNFDSDDPNEDSVEARMATINGRFSPLSGRFQPYALLGMGWVNVQSDHENGLPNLHKSSFGMRFGLGVTAFITNRAGLMLESGYVLPLTGELGGGESFDLIPFTLSFFFRFS